MTVDVDLEFAVEESLRLQLKRRDNTVALRALSGLIAQAALAAMPESAQQALDTPDGLKAFKAVSPHIIRAYFRAMTSFVDLPAPPNSSRGRGVPT